MEGSKLVSLRESRLLRRAVSGSPRSGGWRFVAAACGFLLALGACSSGPGTGGGGKAGTGASGGGGASAGGPGGAVGNAGASGQSGGAAGSGGTSSGGRSGAGGIAGAGAGGHGGAGGTTGGQGGAAGVCGAPAPPALPTGLVGPFACRGGWDIDASFASLAFDSADAIWGSAAGDIYVAGAAAGRGAIAHFDGAAWTRLGGVPAPNLPARYVTVWGTSANDVWAGGSSSVSRRVNQGAWTDASSGLPAGTNTRVVSLWGSGDAVFAAVDTQANASTFSAGIYQWSGTSWQRKSTPAVTGNFELRGVWGWSPGNFYVVGGKLDGSGKRTVPILWTYDGCAWSDQSNVLPPDTRELVAVNGTNGQVIVGGYFTGTTADKIGALEFITVGAFVRWDDVSPVGALMNRIDSVWIDVSGGALLGGAVETPIGTVAAGNARIGYGSGALTNAPIDGSAAVVTGFWNAPGSNQVWTITYSTAAPANIYLGTCQQYDPNNG